MSIKKKLTVKEHRERRTRSQAKYRASHPEIYREIDRRYREKNLEKVHNLNRKYQQKIRKKLVSILGGKCVICKTTERLSVTGIDGSLAPEIKTRFNNSQMKAFKFYIDHPDEAREKLKVLCVTDGRKRLTGREYIFSPAGLERHIEARAKQKIPYKDSSIEKIIQRELHLLNIVFDPHKVIKIPPWRPHQVDIFIEPNICIEADGEYYHSFPKVMERDRIVKTELSKHDYEILRFPERQIKKNLQLVMDKILKNLVYPYFSMQIYKPNILSRHKPNRKQYYFSTIPVLA